MLTASAAQILASRSTVLRPQWFKAKRYGLLQDLLPVSLMNIGCRDIGMRSFCCRSTRVGQGYFLRIRQTLRVTARGINLSDMSDFCRLELPLLMVSSELSFTPLHVAALQAWGPSHFSFRRTLLRTVGKLKNTAWHN